MSLTPKSFPEPLPAHIGEPSPGGAQPRRSNRLLRVCFSIFTLEVGLFLVVFPWMDAWDLNYLQDLAPWVQDLWLSNYFRGAVSGLGLVNVYLALAEAVRLLRK